MKLLRWSDSDRREPVGPVNGRNRSPTGWSRPADCRTCPTLRNLFPTSPSSFSPISPFFSSSSFAFWDQTKQSTQLQSLVCLVCPLNRSFTTGLFYRNHTFLLPAVRVTLLPPSSSSFRQLQLFQWIDHNVFVTSYSPATRTIHSVGQRPRRPARQRHAVLPPSTMGASSVCTLNSPPRLPCLCTCSTTLGSCLGCSLCLYQRPAVSKKKRRKD